MLEFEKKLKGKKIFLTGHTGFTGSWAVLWLKRIQAEIVGFSLPPETEPSLFKIADLEKDVKSIIGDIRNYDALLSAMKECAPELVLHLAAQPLVRRSYREPLLTYETNVIGTANVMEAVRSVPSVKSLLVVTTDKVYKNKEWEWSYREIDELGGGDPYSASKAAAEFVIDSYADKVYPLNSNSIGVATARGGNIIGGGDWSEDRLIPDFVRSVVDEKTLNIRSPDATRPWQHVLALVQGYLMLLAGMTDNSEYFSGKWNFGPYDSEEKTVRDVIEILSDSWKWPQIEYGIQNLPEAGKLTIDSSLARKKLGWLPPWSTEKAIQETSHWYRQYYSDPSSIINFSLNQVDNWRGEIEQKKI